MDENESIADALRASFDEHSETGETEAPVDETQPEVSEPVEEVEAAEEPEGIPEVAEAEEDSEAEEPETVFQAPEHWSSDEKEQFNALPPEAQEILLERDKAFQKGYQERVQDISEIQQALEPWKQYIAQLGVSEGDAIRTLLAAHSQLTSDPVRGIQNLAQSFGVLDQLKSQFAPDTDEEDFTDPEVKALRSQIDELKNQLGQFQNQTQQRETQTLQQTIDSFKNETDAEGNLKHPHFDSVRTLMAPLVQQGKTLEEAYEQVVWSVPEFRDSQLKKPENDMDKAKRVRQAKKASRANKSNGKEDPSKDSVGSLKDELRAAWNQAAS